MRRDNKNSNMIAYTGTVLGIIGYLFLLILAPVPSSPNFGVEAVEAVDDVVVDNDDECVELNEFWMSPSYNVTLIYDDGEVQHMTRSPENLTIANQIGCQFAGIHSSLGFDGDILTNAVAGNIVPLSSSSSSSNNKQGNIIDGDSMYVEIGFLTGLFRISFSDEYEYMHVLGTGRSSAGNVSFAFAFDTTYAAVGTNVDINTTIRNDDSTTGDCIDVSGVWYSDPYYFYHIDQQQNAYIGGPSTNIQNFTQENGSCHVTVSKTVFGIHVNGSNTRDYYFVGVVVGSQVELTAPVHGHDIKAFVSESIMTMDEVYRDDNVIGVAKKKFARDTAPNIPEQNCTSLDLVSTWQSIDEPVITNLVQENGDILTVSDNELSFDIIYQSVSGCLFAGIKNATEVFTGVVHPDGKTATTVQFSPNNVGISNININDNDDGDISGMTVTLAGHEIDRTVSFVSHAEFVKSNSSKNNDDNNVNDKDDTSDDNDSDFMNTEQAPSSSTTTEGDSAASSTTKSSTCFNLIGIAISIIATTGFTVSSFGC